LNFISNNSIFASPYALNQIGDAISMMPNMSSVAANTAGSYFLTKVGHSCGVVIQGICLLISAAKYRCRYANSSGIWISTVVRLDLLMRQWRHHPFSYHLSGTEVSGGETSVFLSSWATLKNIDSI
jgi:hypothetical protein